METTEYRIKICYQTGGSNESHNEEEVLDLTWHDVAIAKDNLARIKEHYEQHREINYGRKLTRDKIFAQSRNKEWFVYVPKLYCIDGDYAIDEKDKKKVGDGNWEYRPDQYYAEQCLYLKADNGNNMQLSAFWIGHFEKLHSVEIEINNDGMKIEF